MADELTTLLTGMSEGEWKQLADPAGDQLDDVMTPRTLARMNRDGGNSPYVDVPAILTAGIGIEAPSKSIDAWNGAAIGKGTRKGIYYLGGAGGHNDGGSNEVFSFDLNDAAASINAGGNGGSFVRVTDQNPMHTSQDSGYIPYGLGGYHHIAPTQVSDLQTAPQYGPHSSHCYNGIEYDEVNDRLWIRPGAKYSGAGGLEQEGPVHLFYFDFAANSWNRILVTYGGEFDGLTRPFQLAVPPKTNGPHDGKYLFTKNHALFSPWRYEIATNLWQRGSFDGGGSNHSSHAPNIIIPARDGSGDFDWVVISSTGGISVFPNIVAGTDAEYTVTVSGSFSHDDDGSQDYRSVDDSIYHLDGPVTSGTIHTLDLSSLTSGTPTVTAATPSVSNAPSNVSLGVEGRTRFRYMPEYDAFVCYATTWDGTRYRGDQQIWLWKPYNWTLGVQPDAPTIDGVTTQTISVSLSVQVADPDTPPVLQFRKTGDLTWLDALPMATDDQTTNPWGGMVINLEEATDYQIRVNADGTLHNVSTTTAAIPVKQTGAATSSPTNITDLNNAIAAANAGDIIEIPADTTIVGSVDVTSKVGTLADPITIRGADRYTSIIDASGEGFGIDINNSDYIYVEDLSIRNADGGIRIRDWISAAGSGQTTGITIRGNILSGHANDGIYAKANNVSDPSHTKLYIANNRIYGPHTWQALQALYDANPSDPSFNITWNHEGIVVTGSEIELANNTIEGQGDGLGTSQCDNNYAIHIHHNLVRWGGDDGIEHDFAVRNICSQENLIANCGGGGLSFQPVGVGPAYGIKNVLLNIESGPYKIKPA